MIKLKDGNYYIIDYTHGKQLLYLGKYKYISLKIDMYVFSERIMNDVIIEYVYDLDLLKECSRLEGMVYES